MTLERCLSIAMANPDRWSLKIRYEAKDGCIHDRFVSPIRLESASRFLALCLCREEPRLFYLDRCLQWRLVKSCDLVMPVEIVEVRKAVPSG